MTDLATLRARRESLKKAMSSGALSIGHGDKRVQYRTVAEMREVLATIDAEIAELVGPRRKRVHYLSVSRGY